MLTYFRQPTKAPDALVKKGRFSWGTFNGMVDTINPQEAKSPLGAPLPAFLKRFRLKEWQAFQFGNARFFCLSAIYNPKTMGLVQLVVIDRLKKRKYLFQRQLPPWQVHVGSDLKNGVSVSRGNGFFFSAHNHLDEGGVRHTILTGSRGQTPGLSVSIYGKHTPGLCTPLSICHPFGENRALYSHKALMPMSGTLCIGDERFVFEADESFLIMDDHKGFYPFAMKYDWVTAAGINEKGGLSGFNLTCNQVKNPEKYNENGLWENGNLHLLPPITVTRPKGHMEAWDVQDRYGRVRLKFYPEYDGRVDLNVLPFKVRYRAPYGVFEGNIVDDHGVSHSFDGFFGMGEDKYIRG